MRKPDRRRLNLELTVKTLDRLEDIMIRSNASSKTEVITRALQMYDLVLDTQANGGSIVLEQGGDLKKLKVLT